MAFFVAYCILLEDDLLDEDVIEEKKSTYEEDKFSPFIERKYRPRTTIQIQAALGLFFRLGKC